MKARRVSQSFEIGNLKNQQRWNSWWYQTFNVAFFQFPDSVWRLLKLCRSVLCSLLNHIRHLTHRPILLLAHLAAYPWLLTDLYRCYGKNSLYACNSILFCYLTV